MTLADKIVVLRDGRIEQAGRPLDLYHRPANRFVAGFIGSPKMNFLPVTVREVQGSQLGVALADGSLCPVACSAPVAPGEALTLGVRPEHLRVLPAGQGAWQGEVAVAERLGGESYFHVRLAGQTVIVRLTEDAHVGVGERIGLQFDPATAHLFSDDGSRLP